MNLKPLVIAHRGASGYAPETTLEAYRLALQMGADGIEMDVHRSRDGVIVAIHDPDVERTTNGSGQISDLTLADLMALDAGSWFNDAFPKKARPEYIGLKIPTLQEIIDMVKESTVRLFIEIKDPERYPQDLESSLLSLICGNQLEKRVRFLSFSSQSVRKIKALNPAIQTAFLVSDPGKDPVSAALEISAGELAIRHNLATPAIVDAAHGNGLSVAVWTVDRQADMRRMIEIGVDCITTNYPDRLLKLLGREQPSSAIRG
jgi:glycerophosphoryl diester phosphodiesterase